jgi:TATA-box binding protein (TBP) (component of TFIID and TFIIIB)
MTFIADLSFTIDIERLNKNFKSPSYPVCSIKRTKKHHEYETTKRGKKKLSFYNQITINYEENTTKSIKIFSNGRLQMTGITSYNEAKYAANVIIKIIKDSIDESANINASKFEIALINSNFSFKNHLDILKLRTYITDCKVDYKPDVYPGLKIRHISTGASIFLFSTGNVVITGVKSITSIQKAFMHITKNVIDNYSAVKLPILQVPKVKKIPISQHGYKITEYNAAL